MKLNMTFISSLILGGCILLAALLISNKLEKDRVYPKNDITLQNEKQLLTGPELAKYLGITEPELSKLLATINPQYPDDSREIGLSYIKINGKLYFAKKAVDEWLLTGQGKYAQIAQ